MTRQETGRQYQSWCSREEKALEIQGGTNVGNHGTKPVWKGGTAMTRKPREGPTKARENKTAIKRKMQIPGNREQRRKRKKNRKGREQKRPTQRRWQKPHSNDRKKSTTPNRREKTPGTTKRKRTRVRKKKYSRGNGPKRSMTGGRRRVAPGRRAFRPADLVEAGSQRRRVHERESEARRATQAARWGVLEPGSWERGAMQELAQAG